MNIRRKIEEFATLLDLGIQRHFRAQGYDTPPPRHIVSYDGNTARIERVGHDYSGLKGFVILIDLTNAEVALRVDPKCCAI